MIKMPSTEIALERVLKDLREMAYSGRKGHITVHFDGKRLTRIEKVEIKPIEE